MSDEEHNTDKVENPHENAQGTQKLAFLGKKWWFSGFFQQASNEGLELKWANRHTYTQFVFNGSGEVNEVFKGKKEKKTYNQR